MANSTALPIEQVHTGDIVMSRNAATGATAAKRVLSTSVRPVDNTLDVQVGGETIHTTRNHPFAVKGFGFVPAGQLAKSDRLQTAAGTLLAPRGFHAITGGGSALVYNFVVADWHTYFVGKNHVWVHNGDVCAPIAKFRDYIFKPGADHGKDAVFKALGYGRENSEELARIWQEQAAEKFARGEYTLGKADEYGQRINIEIDLKGIGDAADKVSHMNSGWMLKDGNISLNTPFSGFTKAR